VGSFARDIREAVERLLAPENYERFRNRAAAMQNRAVYEIPDLLEQILNSQRSAAKSSAPLLCAISPRSRALGFRR
jgi:hypothetical protein